MGMTISSVPSCTDHGYLFNTQSNECQDLTAKGFLLVNLSHSNVYILPQQKNGLLNINEASSVVPLPEDDLRRDLSVAGLNRRSARDDCVNRFA